jgi:hypothetical protein
MKWLFAILLVGGIAFAVSSVPKRKAARVAARALRAGWDWVASIGTGAGEADAPARTAKRRPWRKVQAAAPQAEAGQRRATSREGIVPQPPKEDLRPADRQELDSLIAEPPARAGYR